MGYGIQTNGTDITIHRHKSFDNSRHGIRISSGATNVTVTDSNARNNAETGIAIQLGATGTTATGNRASNNTRVDLCDEGTGSTLTDNNPELQFFDETPAAKAVDLAGQMFPAFRPRPKVEDTAPLIDMPEIPAPIVMEVEASALGTLAVATVMLGVAAMLWMVGRAPYRRAQS